MSSVRQIAVDAVDFAKLVRHDGTRVLGFKLHDANSPARAAMRSVYKEMLSPPAILVAIVMVAVVVAAFAVLGPMGTYGALTAWQRLAFGALYAVIGWPLGYAAVVVAAYFLRRQSALTMALTLTAVALFVSLPCAAVVHTIETLAHPHYSASAGLPRLYIQVATVAVLYDLLFLYLVYVRTRHGHALAAARIAHTNSAVAAAAPAGEPIDRDGAGAATSAESAATTTGAANETGDAGHAAVDTRRETVGATARAPGRSLHDVEERCTSIARRPSSSDQSREPAGTSRELEGTQQNQAERVSEPPLAGVRTDGGASAKSGGAGDGSKNESRLPELLSDELGSDVIFLKSEDHYVQVRTSAGAALIKMRFADAIAELGGAGIQVHRSYWVAVHHMRELTKRDRKLMLRLSGDHLVPISARHRAAVQAVLQSRELDVNSSN